MKSPLALHIETWQQCTLCPYSERRSKVVIGKGRSPCDILFVGEAPGDSEDASGVPFDGQAGRLLEQIVASSRANHLRKAYTNLVACIPLAWDEKEGRWEKEDPDHECVMACKLRLEEFIRIVSPKLIVTVGKQATEYLEQSWKDGVRAPGIRQTGIQHPSSIRRAPFVQRSLMVQRCVAAIRREVRDIWGDPK